MRNLLAFVFTTLTVVFVWAYPAIPLPPTTVRKSQLKSVEQAIPRQWISSAIEIPGEFAGHLESRPDLITVELEAIDALIDDKSIPNRKKSISAVRYTLGDPRMSAALVRAKKAGIQVQVIFDPNPVFKVKFREGETIVTDPHRFIFQDEPNDGVEFIRALKRGGFVLGKDLVTQPLYNHEILPRIPIMHEKGLVIGRGENKIAYLSSMNWPHHKRINEVVEIVDPELVREIDGHLTGLAEAYRHGGETKDLVPFERVTHVYKDGSSFEFAFTNGMYNPNDRIRDALDPETTRTDAILFLHFAFTNRVVSKAMIAAAKANPGMTIFGASDGKFSTAYGWGVAATLIGVTVNPEVGRSVWGAPLAVAKNVESYVYAERAVHAETDEPIYSSEEDGAPTDRALLHTKITVLKQQDVTTQFRGTFNNSSNVVNADWQMMIRSDKDSRLNRATEYWMRETVKADPEAFIPMQVSLVRSELAHIIKVSELDIELSVAREITKALLAGNYDEAAQKILALADVKTHIAKPLKRGERIQRLETYNALYTLYRMKLPSFRSRQTELRSFLGTSVLFANPALSNGRRFEILDKVAWRPKLKPAQLKKFMTAAFSLLDFGQVPRLSAASDEEAPRIRRACGDGFK